MTKIILFVIFLYGFISCSTEPEIVSTIELFNEGWSFRRIERNSNPILSDLVNTNFDTRWEKIRLPHTPRIEDCVIKRQWQGNAIYTKTFILTDTDLIADLFLKFDAAMNYAEIFINGNKAMEHLGGYLPFVVNLNPHVHKGTNTIVVKLNNEDNLISGPKPLHQLDFNTYGGLYRDVWLIKKRHVYITDEQYAATPGGGGIFFYTQSANPNRAVVGVKCQLYNQDITSGEITLTHKLGLATGEVVAHRTQKIELLPTNSNHYETNLEILDPNLWSPGRPYLYNLETIVKVNEVITDYVKIQVGIRVIELKNNKLWINGEQCYLRGVNRHQEYPYIGYALSNAAQYRDAYKIKQAGFDYVRASHYPPSPAFLDACDELGILVMDAILGWQFFGDSLFQEYAYRSARELIRRDRNHPSVFAWELSINETIMPDLFMRQMNRLADEEYPYLGMLTSGWRKGYYDIYLEARQHRHDVDTTYPLLVSEYGDWEYYAQNAGFNQDCWSDLKTEEKTSRQPRGAGEKRLLQQALNVQEAHNDNLMTHAFGDGYWVMYDYNRGYADDLEYSGIMDIFRLPKYAYYFFQSQRTPSLCDPIAKPMLFIASDWVPNQSKGVRVFSNCQEVELYENGCLVAKKTNDTNRVSTHIAYPPFNFDLDCTQPGTLTAIGYRRGKEVVRTTLRSAEITTTLDLKLDISGKEPQFGCNDIIFIYAYLKDEHGTTVHHSDRIVSFESIGDIEIIGPKEVKTEAGIAAVLIRLGDSTSRISKIKAVSEELQGEIRITNAQK